jgi:hypothetical protein
MRSDTSIQPDQVRRLRAMDPGGVAAVLAAVLVGRTVRCERFKTAEEVKSYGLPEVPWGGVYTVTEVVVRNGRVWMVGDEGLAEDVTDVDRFTWWVEDRREGQL